MKIIVGIFAHPDDEAFGPSGTIATLAQENDVYLICATKGEAGKSAQAGLDLPKVRAQELEESAQILGVKEVFFLGFQDGTLCNNVYHSLAEKIETILKKLQPDTIITYEPRGVSGHIDHITISMVSCFIFHKLSFIKQIWQYCISKENRDAMPQYYIYFPHGYKKEDIDKRVDVSSVWDLKEKSMRAHASQLHDIERVLKTRENLPREEYFLVHKK